MRNKYGLAIQKKNMRVRSNKNIDSLKCTVNVLLYMYISMIVRKVFDQVYDEQVACTIFDFFLIKNVNMYVLLLIIPV